MSKSELYQRAKGLINYFNDKKINIRTGMRLKNDEINMLGKKYVGTTKKSWERRVEILEKLRSKKRTGKKILKGIKSRVLNSKLVTGVFSWTLIYSISKSINQIRTGTIIIKKPNTINNINEIARKNMMDLYGGVVNGAFMASFTVHQGDAGKGKKIGDMTLKDVKFFKLKEHCTANDKNIKENCVYESLMEYYGNEKYYGKKARAEAENTEKWTVDIFLTYMEKYKLDYEIYHRHNELYKKGTFGAKRKVMYAITKNEHLYLIEKGEMEKLFENNDINNIVVADVGEVVQDIIENQNIDSFSVKYDAERQKYYFNSCVSDGVKYTDNVKLLDAFLLYNKVYGEGIYKFDNNFKIYSPFIKIAEDYKLKSTYINLLEKPKAVYYNTKGDGEYCIDKNKAYTWVLSTLKYIPVINASSH